MAVSNLWPVRYNLGQVINYAANPDKTDADTYTQEQYQALADVLSYAKNEEKTEKQFYVQGINCDPEIVRTQYINIKKRFNKTEGIQAYHGWVSEETAHIIKGLKIGETYTVTEEGDVEGYLPLEEPLTFTVTDDTYAVVYEIRNDPVPKNKTFVAKVDEVGNPVKGAVLQILEGETVIYEFTSGVEPVEVSDYLECGKEYIPREIETPYGYETSIVYAKDISIRRIE